MTTHTHIYTHSHFCGMGGKYKPTFSSEGLYEISRDVMMCTELKNKRWFWADDPQAHLTNVIYTANTCGKAALMPGSVIQLTHTKHRVCMCSSASKCIYNTKNASKTHFACFRDFSTRTTPLSLSYTSCYAHALSFLSDKWHCERPLCWKGICFWKLLGTDPTSICQSWGSFEMKDFVCVNI